MDEISGWVNSTISLQKLGWVEVHESDLIDKLITIQDKLNSSEYDWSPMITLVLLC